MPNHPAMHFGVCNASIAIIQNNRIRAKKTCLRDDQEGNAREKTLQNTGMKQIVPCSLVQLLVAHSTNVVEAGSQSGWKKLFARSEVFYDDAGMQPRQRNSLWHLKKTVILEGWQVALPMHTNTFCIAKEAYLGTLFLYPLVTLSPGPIEVFQVADLIGTIKIGVTFYVKGKRVGFCVPLAKSQNETRRIRWIRTASCGTGLRVCRAVWKHDPSESGWVPSFPWKSIVSDCILACSRDCLCPFSSASSVPSANKFQNSSKQ